MSIVGVENCESFLPQYFYAFLNKSTKIPKKYVIISSVNKPIDKLVITGI